MPQMVRSVPIKLIGNSCWLAEQILQRSDLTVFLCEEAFVDKAGNNVAIFDAIYANSNKVCNGTEITADLKLSWGP